MSKSVTNYLRLHLLLSVLWIHGCIDIPDEVILPRWDVELNIPITERSYFLSEILDSARNPNIDIFSQVGVADSLYMLVSSDISGSAAIQDTIKIPVQQIPTDFDLSGTVTPGTPIRRGLVYNPDPEFHLLKAEFKSGTINLKLNNESSVPVKYTFVLPGFINRITNAVLELNGTLNPNSSFEEKINLALYRYEERPVLGFNQLNHPYASQASPGFFFVGIAEVTESGLINFGFTSEITSDEIIVSRMEGRLKRTELARQIFTFDNTFGQDVGDFGSKIKFQEIDLNFASITTGDFEGLKIIIDSLMVTGYDILPNGNRANTIPLLFDGNPYLVREMVAGVPISLVFNETNTNLTDFLTSFPDEIEVSTKFVIDNVSATSTGVVSSEDSIHYTIDIRAPLKVSLSDAGYADTVKIEGLSEENRKDIVNGNSANLTLELENMIPLGVLAKVTMLDKNYDPLFILKSSDNNVVGDIIQIGSAAINNEGIPITPATQTTTLLMDKDDFRKFAETEYVLIDVAVRSTGSTATNFGPFVRVRAKDWVKFKIYGGINYYLDLDR
jgi:hypothetical protein